MSCDRCPCPGACRRLPAYCEWAAREPQNPIEIRHICDASRNSPVSRYPPLARQAANLAGAVGRAVAAAIGGEAVTVPGAVLAARQAACAGCEHHDAAANRCRMCGCSGAKLHVATERCPLDPPRWDRWQAP